MKREQRLLIHGKGVYDSEQRKISHNSLLIQDGVIREIGAYEELAQKYDGVDLLDCPDEYILPGMINTHVHLELTPGESAYAVYVAETEEEHWEKAILHARQMLDSGVTTARDLGSSMDFVKRLKSLSNEDREHLPKLQVSGMPLTEKGGHMSFLGEGADTEDELRTSVRKLWEVGCDCIKIIANGGQNTPGSSPENDAYDEKRIRLIVEEAHKLGLTTVTHCLTTSSFLNVMRAGVDCIEHIACFVRTEKEKLLARIYIPEIMEEFRGDHRWFMIGFSNNYHRLDEVREGKKTPSPDEIFWLEQEKREAEIFQNIMDLGLRPVVGTDGGCGFTYFDETWLEVALLVERCGLAEADAIHVATANGAEALGIGERTGQIKEGFDADLILLKENPLEQIRALRNVTHVIRNGILIR